MAIPKASREIHSSLPPGTKASRLKGRLPIRSFGALYLLLLAGAWAYTTWFRPEPPFAAEIYWFPLAGLFVIAAALWVSAALSRMSVRTDALSLTGGDPSRSRRWGIPMPAGLYMAVLAILAIAALLGNLK